MTVNDRFIFEDQHWRVVGLVAALAQNIQGENGALPSVKQGVNSGAGRIRYR
ncbi:MAG: hypothetical protein WDN46_25585 [Methylocella sp.]